MNKIIYDVLIPLVKNTEDIEYILTQYWRNLKVLKTIKMIARQYSNIL